MLHMSIGTKAIKHEEKHEGIVKPLPLWQALLYFGIPALLFKISVYGGFPLLEGMGISQYLTLLITYITPLALLMGAAIVFYRRDGYVWTRQAFAERFRLRRMGWKAWLLTACVFILGYLGTGALQPISGVLATIPLFAPPAFLPVYLTPAYAPSLSLSHFMGVSLYGNWAFLLSYVFLLFMNIVGEELWWRGYILPRQELVHGKWTWLLHGVLWTLFHVPIYPWNIITLLPTCLSISFVAQRLKNTWPGMVMHFIGNGLILIPILFGILGAGR